MSAALLSPQRLAAAGLSSADTISVDGSLHYESTGVQAEDETIVLRRVDFTAEEQITAFAEIAPNVLWVGTWQTTMGSFKFTFSHRGSYYLQAGIHHYSGDAVYPAFAAQLIDDVSQFNQAQVVSNSLPIWLAMLVSPPFPSLITLSLDLYPSFLVPDNLPPPYGVIDIPPSGTQAIQGTAWMNGRSSRWQLVRDRVRITLYGLDNDAAMDFADYVTQYSDLSGLFGVMNYPVIADEKRTQVELATVAMKKTIEYEINYHQQRARDIARGLIALAVPTFYPSDVPVTPAPVYIVPPT